MTKEELFESMDGIDEEILEESERVVVRSPVWKTLLPLAACLGVIIAAAMLLPKLLSERDDPSPVLPPANGNWTVNYMEKGINTSMPDVTYVHFYEDLNSAELEAVMPVNRPEWLQATGYSGFDKEGNLQMIRLHLHTTLKYATADVSITQKASQNCVFYDGAVSVCNGVEFYVYAYETGEEQSNLGAEAWINDNWFTFSLQVWTEDLDQAKADFKQILESFTYYGEQDKTTWDSVTYDSIPETYDKSITLEDAWADESFGAFVPKTAPEDLELLGCNRHKSYGQDYLQIQWGTGDTQISWTVTAYDPRTDERWMTSIYDIYKRYTQSYAIFQAEDLTRNIINTYSGGRHRLGVKYGDYLVRIELRKLNDIDWVWDQLEAVGLVTSDNTIYTDRWIPTMEEGAADPKFGNYIPEDIDIYGKAISIHRYESDRADYLLMQVNGNDTLLSLQVTDYEGQSITPVENIEEYNLTEYTSPWDETIPEVLRATMERPIFDADSLTLDAVCARVYYAQTSRKEPRMEFGIRCGNVVVYVFASGIAPEAVYDTIRQIQQ